MPTNQQKRNIIKRTKDAFIALGAVVEANFASKREHPDLLSKRIGDTVATSATGETIEFDVPMGGKYGIFHVQAKKIAPSAGVDDEYEVTISDKDGAVLTGEHPLYLEKLKGQYFFSCDIATKQTGAEKELDYGSADFSQRVGSNSGFALRQSQMSALQGYTDSLDRKGYEEGGLFLMGTGTGKTILQAALVVANLGQPQGGAIVVVPSPDLVDGAVVDFKRFIQPKDQDNLKKYSERAVGDSAIDPNNVTIMTASELRDYIEESKKPGSTLPKLDGRDILIDEVHQWTYSKSDTTMLQELKASNRLVGVTATPTGVLNELFGAPVCDIGLNAVMTNKDIRWVKEDVLQDARQADKNMQVKDAVDHYYSTATVLTAANKGFVDVRASLKADMNDTAKQALVDKAIKGNIYCTWNQKNMLFSSDTERLSLAAANYNRAPSGDEKAEFKRKYETALRANLSTAIGKIYTDAGLAVDTAVVNEKVNSILESNKFLSTKSQEQLFREEVTKNVELIARGTLNAAGDRKRFIVPEELTVEIQEKGSYPNIAADATVPSQGDIKLYLEERFPGLKAEEREHLSGLIHNAAGKLKAGEQINVLSDADLRQIGAQYAAVLEKPANSEDPKLVKSPVSGTTLFEDEIVTTKSKLMLGLCHHIVNNDGMVTGISLKDVLSSQHLFTGDFVHDPLNSAQNVAQAYGRAIRTGTGVASEYVSAPPGVAILTPEQMTSKAANDNFLKFQARQRGEIKGNSKFFAKKIAQVIEKTHATALTQGKSAKDASHLAEAAAVKYVQDKILMPLYTCNDWNKEVAQKDFRVLMNQVTVKLRDLNLGSEVTKFADKVDKRHIGPSVSSTAVPRAIKEAAKEIVRRSAAANKSHPSSQRKRTTILRARRGGKGIA